MGLPVASTRAIARDIRWVVVVVVLAATVVAVYLQTGAYGFLNFDDAAYLTGNPVVRRGLTLEGASWAFTTFHAGNWHPLAWLSHMVDVELFGLSAGWHHRVNVLCHLLNTELLFLVLWRMTGGLWQSAFAAALFGVHPLHVESVAWVAERKDLLSALFWIVTMGAYLRYVRRPGIRRYLPVIAAFALGLLCKPMLVTLPFVLLLLDWWPLGRMAPPGSPDPLSWPPSGPALRRLAWEKVPLFALSAASSAVTYLAQSSGSGVIPLQRLPFWSRIANASVSYVVYLAKTVWPSSLAVFYPHPASVGAGIPAWEVAGSVLLLCGLSVVALRQGGRRPFIAVGWLWYVGTLIPVIGLVQVGGQAYADRYTYVPLIGVFVAVAWGVPAALSGLPFRRFIAGALAGVALAALAAGAWIQAGYWRDSMTLSSRAVAVTDRNWLALNDLGLSCDKAGRSREAVGHYREALRIRPDYADAWNNLGVALNNLGRPREAIDQFREAARLRPAIAEAWCNMGVSNYRLGQFREAADSFRVALRIRPDFAEARAGLAAADRALGRSP